ncbi:OmpH family outer membrane protein [bacterium]|nr:OmpH family outer membrane protein [bacterium]
MKNNLWFIIACVLVFFVGYNVNNVAVSLPRYKVAVVDVPTILSKSSEIQSLKISQDKKMDELNTLISKAQNEIVNEPDRNKALQKEATYRKEIETKKKVMEEEYNTKIAGITTKIRSLISNEAKKTNYNLVLPTGMVISGGEDITNEIVKKLK